MPRMQCAAGDLVTLESPVMATTIERFHRHVRCRVRASAPAAVGLRRAPASTIGRGA